jgi:ABC-type bacteriocin/lantibiotic exporter with double-glycine peptidase domain
MRCFGRINVYRQFRDMAQGKSVLLISHRLGSARLADRSWYWKKDASSKRAPTPS